MVNTLSHQCSLKMDGNQSTKTIYNHGGSDMVYHHIPSVSYNKKHQDGYYRFRMVYDLVYQVNN